MEIPDLLIFLEVLSIRSIVHFHIEEVWLESRGMSSNR